MKKHAFLDDYSEGCHPDILQAMTDTNLAQQPAYGNDEYSERARDLIRAELRRPEVPVYFVSGGTLANLIIISSALRSHEAVISAHSGHIALWETGAIEATGHKIISVQSDDGKLTPDDITATLELHSQFPHVAKPRLVYISNATEVGTVYDHAEVAALAQICKANQLLLMLDGARLGPAVCAPNNDLTLEDVATLTDIFWIGGTKAGALIGEAIVIPNPQLAEDFAFHIKQRGALLAKGRLLGLQFFELFKDGLFYRLNHHSNSLAQRIGDAFVSQGYDLFAPTQSNQVFPVLPVSVVESLRSVCDFHDWEPVGEDRAAVRFVTSWATQDEHVDTLIRAIPRNAARA